MESDNPPIAMRSSLCETLSPPVGRRKP